ncbi:MAG: hypothetical protein IKC03_10135 [Oscillospiraceae bacterium]|nr:hypothetical protein [Oscillospiraceae bacterium]
MTKKNCLCAIICILMCFTLISCSSDSIDSKNIVGTMGLGNGDMIFDTSTIQGATEYADLIIIGTISEIEDINFDEVDVPVFDYSISVDKIYYDRNNVVSNKLSASKAIINNSITLTIRNNGYLKASEYQSYIEGSNRAQKFGIANEVYSDNDYFEFVSFGGIVLEEGKSYVLFLDTENYEKDKSFNLASEVHTYEINDSTLISGYQKTRATFSLEQLELEINDAISNRAGILDAGLAFYKANLDQTISD